MTYIALLRGINVSGQKKINMKALEALFKGLGFEDVHSYIQSGNIIFKTGLKPAEKELSMRIEQAILHEFGFQVPVILRTVEEIKSVIESNPFHFAPDHVPEKIYITFMEENPDQGIIDSINPMNYLPDKFVIHSREIYLDCSGGYGTTKLSNTFFENKLKVRATTRNWKTVNQLYQMANC
jgi:uncharacterized protein (DUF1697 family)